MKEKRKQKTGKVSYIFTKETLGMTILLFSAIVLLMLFTYDMVFSYIGTAICTFMYGTFGYGSFFVIALTAYLGAFLVFEKKITIKHRGVALAVSGSIVVLFLLFHAVTTRDFALDSYGGYLSSCYESAAAGWSGYTFGGAVSGLLVYPVAWLTTFIGAYVIFSALLLLCGYLVYYAYRHLKPAKVKERVPEVSVLPARNTEASEVEHTNVQAVDNAYAVSENQQIVNNVNMPPQFETTEAEEDDDKFSQSNLGRKILFENGEFAAESYRRNMIFNEDSYFNHPIRNDSDYLSSFSSNPKPASQPAQTQSYTQSYQENVANQPEAEMPSNYIYGDKPVDRLDGFDSQYGQEQNNVPPESNEAQYVESIREPENTHIEESVQPRVEPIQSREEPVQPRVEPVQSREEPAANNNFAENSRSVTPLVDEPEEVAPRIEPTERVETPPEIAARRDEDAISPLFGGDARRSERGVESKNTSDNARSKSELFDDGDDLDSDPFSSSPRSDSPAAERRGVERSESFGRVEPSTASSREVGFTIPASERRAPEPAPEPPKAEEPAPVEKPKHVWKKYVRPSLDLLDDYPENNNVNTDEIENNKGVIIETLESFNIRCEITDVIVGPAITRYDVKVLDNHNIKRSLNYKDAIAMALMKENINAYLNYAKGALSIEIPNNKRAIVGLKTMLASPEFFNSKPNSITFGLGKNVEGKVVCPDITKMPHLLVAGTTGSGKSVCLSTLIVSLLYKYGPDELRLILVDPKQNEFVSYNKLPHLMINEILYEIDKVIKALNWAINEMERRYQLFKEMTENGMATKDLGEYNSHLKEGEEKLPKIVIILDEFGDLMLQAKKDIEGRIIRLVQKSRACGIHLILATQRPSVDCITGLIKSNLPTRIGFKVNSFADSSTIFDVGGAEKLLGMGDLYFRSTDRPDLARIQGCFVGSSEVQRVTDFVKANNETYFDQDVSDFINKVEAPEASASGGGDMGEEGEPKIDDTFIKALKFCVTSNQASVSMIQRRFPVGYIKACKIIDWMANMNYITQSEGSKPRKVLMSKEEFINTYGDVDD